MPAATDIALPTSQTHDARPLRGLRRERGLTGEQLAAQAGLSLKTIYVVETGRVVPQRATVYVLAAALRCQPEDIQSNEQRPGGHRGVAKTSGGDARDVWAG
jgi:DNA-binding XRE family transcriptional regulator